MLTVVIIAVLCAYVAGIYVGHNFEDFTKE